MCILTACALTPAFAGQEAATGLWLSADKAAVIEF
jgi:hypothetical protein